MDGEEIGIVLARASDLRSKISGCIAAVAGTRPPRRHAEVVEGLDTDEDEEEEVESLVSINDALESLERQLAALQELQHQQRYERETILNQIDRSRRVLLSKLREYKGQDWEVIHETSTFAGEKFEHDDGLILPPYSNHVTNSFVLDDLYPPNYVSKSKHLHNVLDSNGTNQADRKMNGLENSNTCSSNRNPLGGVRSFIGWMTKSVIMVVGVVSIMRAAGYKPVIRRNGVKLENLRLFDKASSNRRQQDALQCPPGKVLVLEDGKAHCVVKERVEIPFDTNLGSPNAKYGFG